jgi:ribosome-associated translation inhibitor RaiA
MNKPLTGLEAAARFVPAARIQVSDIRNTPIEPGKTKQEHDENQHRDGTATGAAAAGIARPLRASSVNRAAAFGRNRLQTQPQPRAWRTMKTTLAYNSLNAQVPWPALLAQQLDHWHSLTTITTAEVVLEHQRDDARAHRVKVQLEVPRPGLRTEASDSTLEGALLMATRDLEHQIQARKTKPLGRGKSTQQPSAISRRGAGRRTGGREGGT